MEEFAERLRDRLAELGWSTRTLSIRSGINNGTISHAVTGTRHTSVRTAQRLAEVLGDPGLLDAHRRATGSGPPPVPQQLPRRSWIAGRDDLIEDAVAHAQSVPRPAIILTGPGGAGKTSLGIEIGYRLIEAGLVPHGQLFTDFLGWTPGGVAIPITDVLASWVRALGGDPGQGDVQRVRAVYREVTAGRRLLIFADNIGDTQREEAAEIGLPHPEIVTIGTSRDRSTGGHRPDDDSMLRLDLDPISTDAAVRVLVRRSGLQPDQVAPLAVASGGLPLVLVGVGSQLARHKRLSAPALGGIITSMTDDLLHPGDTLWSAIKVSYDSLSDDAKRAWRWCAQVGPVVPLPTAAAMLGLRPSQARRAMDAAVESSLLQSEGAGWRYLDLHLAWARQDAPEPTPDERAAGLRRALAWFGATFTLAGERLAPGRGLTPEIPEIPGIEIGLPEDRTYLLSWLDHLWTVWPAHVSGALRAGEHDWAWRVFASTLNYAFLRKVWLTWDHVAAELAAGLPPDHHAGQGWAAHVRGAAAGERGEVSGAIDFATKAVEHWRAIGDDARLGWAALVIARFKTARGDDIAEVYDAVTTARDAFARAGLPNGIANAALMSAGVHVREGDRAAADHALDEAEANIEHDDPMLRALVAELRGRIRLADGDLAAASHELNSAYQIAEYAEDQWTLIGVLDARADLAAARDEPEAAHKARSEAAIIAEELGDPRARQLAAAVAE